ncbi:MAG: phosphoribosylaminoimidazolesuccinocarboxamide synthase [Spirochaetales bacterium]|nr:phosphoribosylaminoimidazolesuccinocarboxamide synthase [Spirochaetales bacterium]
MTTLASLDDFNLLPPDRTYYRGKVRDVLDIGQNLLLVTTDRISAFDRVLGVIPYKGEILNRLACWWLEKSASIVPNHFQRRVGSRSMIGKKAQVIPLEIVVRGYLTGSAWRDYKEGRPTSGCTFPPGLAKNQAFAQPVITPSTKALDGEHDEPISASAILERGLVSADLWHQIQAAALSLFDFGTRLAGEQGLILVDTKYEFGLLPGGELVVVDEIHTPDSSRYWYADSYHRAYENHEEPRSLDKEFLRSWLLAQGYSGQENPPEIPEDIQEQVSLRYQELYSRITGEKFTTIDRGFESERQELAVIL